jgi:hypothetical protein
VLFNIGGPALNQLNDTAQKSKGKKRGVAAGLGLTGASMLAAQNADAAEAIVEAAQKVNDNRVGIIATLFMVSIAVSFRIVCFDIHWPTSRSGACVTNAYPCTCSRSSAGSCSTSMRAPRTRSTTCGCAEVFEARG